MLRTRLLIWVTCLDLPGPDEPGGSGKPGAFPQPFNVRQDPQRLCHWTKTAAFNCLPLGQNQQQRQHKAECPQPLPLILRPQEPPRHQQPAKMQPPDPLLVSYVVFPLLRETDRTWLPARRWAESSLSLARTEQRVDSSYFSAVIPRSLPRGSG